MGRVLAIFLLSYLLPHSLSSSDIWGGAGFFPDDGFSGTHVDIREKCRCKVDHIQNRDFSLFVKEVSDIGGDVVILLQFRSRNGSFDLDFSRSEIRLVDARGRSYRLDGCSVSNFRIASGEAKIFPLVFKNRARSVRQPFKLLIDIYGVGRIVLPGLRIGSASVEI